ncbi:hypothetical protein [Ruegeria sp. THAF33]|uniref:hypothetical protein n=1 Tax=Ruegeria sp. THAF33 TaxID=2587853 RepID=UPI0012692FC6|nr:hypothetical protein [Ruegeria sp. THAF33]
MTEITLFRAPVSEVKKTLAKTYLPRTVVFVAGGDAPASIENLMAQTLAKLGLILLHIFPQSEEPTLVDSAASSNLGSFVESTW